MDNVDDLSKRLENFDGLLDAYKQLSEMLKGAVAMLMREGWTEEQAKGLAVTAYVNSSWPFPKSLEKKDGEE